MNAELIILVEDDLNLRHSIALILQRAGYIVTTTDCVYEAMEILKNKRYRLIISDMNIPETTRVMVPIIHDSYPHLSIIVLTDQSMNNADKEPWMTGADYLIKPIAPERLLESISQLLEKKHQANNHNTTNLQDEWK